MRSFSLKWDKSFFLQNKNSPTCDILSAIATWTKNLKPALSRKLARLTIRRNFCDLTRHVVNLFTTYTSWMEQVTLLRLQKKSWTATEETRMEQVIRVKKKHFSMQSVVLVDHDETAATALPLSKVNNLTFSYNKLLTLNSFFQSTFLQTLQLSYLLHLTLEKNYIHISYKRFFFSTCEEKKRKKLDYYYILPAFLHPFRLFPFHLTITKNTGVWMFISFR